MDFDIQESDAGFRIFESKFYCGVISVKISSDTDPLDKKHAYKSRIKCSNINRERERDRSVYKEISETIRTLELWQ